MNARSMHESSSPPPPSGASSAPVISSVELGITSVSQIGTLIESSPRRGYKTTTPQVNARWRRRYKPSQVAAEDSAPSPHSETKQSLPFSPVNPARQSTSTLSATSSTSPASVASTLNSKRSTASPRQLLTIQPKSRGLVVAEVAASDGSEHSPKVKSEELWVACLNHAELRDERPSEIGALGSPTPRSRPLLQIDSESANLREMPPIHIIPPPPPPHPPIVVVVDSA